MIGKKTCKVVFGDTFGGQVLLVFVPVMLEGRGIGLYIVQFWFPLSSMQMN